MKRSATDILRRGYDSVVANWPLLLVRTAAGIVMFLAAFGVALAAIVPLLVAVGINPSNIAVSGDLLEMLAAHWIALLYVLAVVLVVVTVLFVLYAFVEAGSARVLVDWERSGQRFNVDTWMRGGRSGFWPVFWIYNAAWAVGTVVILAPILIIGTLVFFYRESPAAAAIGCLGIGLTFLVMVPVTIATKVWSEKAIVIATARGTGAMDALAEAWREVRDDFVRHVAVTLVIAAIAIGGSIGLMVVSIPFGLIDEAWFQLAALPANLVLQVVQSLFFTAVGTWMTACFAALTLENRT